MTRHPAPNDPPPAGHPAEVLGVFLQLGLTSFGGPVAHLGYFHRELVLRRAWVSEAAYAELVALCQFLPGPASSQVGFTLGWLRAGPLGGLAAWVGFTLPSALLMLGLAVTSHNLQAEPADRVVHGLKLVALVVVAQAVWGMARKLTPDRRRKAVAVVAAGAVAWGGGFLGQLAALAWGAGAGLLLCKQPATAPEESLPTMVSRRAGVAALALCAAWLLALPVLTSAHPDLRLLQVFIRAGALVFGGGHVVLPLLHADLVPTGDLSNERFLVGYGAAQALPGPLFAVAAYFGTVAGGSASWALPCLLAIFGPGLLLVVGVLPFWTRLRTSPLAQAMVAGIQAAVVGVLAWALYDPLWITGVHSPSDIARLALAGWAVRRWQLPPVLLVVLMVAASFV